MSLGSGTGLYRPRPVQVRDIRDYGAVGDAVTDDTVAIQAAVDAAAAVGGAPVFVPPGQWVCNNLVLKAGVTLSGLSGMHGYGAGGSPTRQSTLINTASGWCIDTPATSIFTCSVIGLNIEGPGAAVASGGIRFQSVWWGKVADVSFNDFANEALLVTAPSIACVFADILTVNVVLNRAPGALRGAVDIAGTDHYLSRIEAGISGSIEGTVQSASLFCVALAIRMDTGIISDCIGEISDVGVHVTGTKNRFSNTRADLNYGHGWVITGSSNQFANCLAISNSMATANTYDQFNVSGVNNFFTNPLAIHPGSTPRYGINDTSVSSDANKNYYNAPYVTPTGIGTASYNFPNTGTAVSFPTGSPRTLTVNSATPDVAGYGTFKTANTGTTTITNFAGGVYGQSIDLFCGDANTTVQHNGSTIILWNVGNLKLRANTWYRFIKRAAWELLSEDPLARGNVTADVGNAAKTLQYRVAEPTQIWATALTADRAVTLSTTGAYAGARFRVVRAATATGAFNLNVGTGPLKALGIGSWCDVEYNGTAWVLTGYGLL